MTGVTLYKGNSSEAVVLAAYIQAGFLVSLPFGGGAAYDLIVDTGARLIRVQVKTGKLESGCIVYNARRHRGSKYNTFKRYQADELDVFAVYCPGSQQIYVVPVEHSLTVEGRLRVVETQNLQEKKIRWARNYSWDKHLDALRAESPTAKKLISGNGLT
ncbi:MAG TPA: group I intron-associated PD-(D/E)XK endonuclease [Pyrinomonadaceae bacterium]|nr:group I intron-associated PD-(D/E)XK endonuclease [Pyrinomonadaceae bacterium]